MQCLTTVQASMPKGSSMPKARCIKILGFLALTLALALALALTP